MNVSETKQVHRYLPKFQNVHAITEPSLPWNGGQSSSVLELLQNEKSKNQEFILGLMVTI